MVEADRVESGDVGTGFYTAGDIIAYIPAARLIYYARIDS